MHTEVNFYGKFVSCVLFFLIHIKIVLVLSIVFFCIYTKFVSVCLYNCYWMDVDLINILLVYMVRMIPRNRDMALCMYILFPIRCLIYL